MADNWQLREVQVLAVITTTLDLPDELSHCAAGRTYMGPAAMSLGALATFLSVDEKTSYRLGNRGEIPGFTVAGTWRFKKDDPDAWIEARKAEIASEARDNEGPKSDRRGSR